MFRDPDVVDFRAEVYESAGNDVLHLTPEVTLLPRGSIAKDFEAAVKAPRFVDKRG